MRRKVHILYARKRICSECGSKEAYPVFMTGRERRIDRTFCSWPGCEKKEETYPVYGRERSADIWTLHSGRCYSCGVEYDEKEYHELSYD